MTGIGREQAPVKHNGREKSCPLHRALDSAGCSFLVHYRHQCQFLPNPPVSPLDHYAYTRRGKIQSLIDINHLTTSGCTFVAMDTR